ncbi:MAG: amylo-alpha-1,6-glucosidase [Thermodesulfobacteriota bacterium]
MGKIAVVLPGLVQRPEPGKSFVAFCGDTVTFELELPFSAHGAAWLRTNLGGASKSRREIIHAVEKEEIRLDGAWYDIPMNLTGEAVFSVTVPLTEPGHFQAKCFFMETGAHDPVWPEGENCIINAEPAGTCGANIIYNAFVRQFSETFRSRGAEKERIRHLAGQIEEHGYTVIPESGKFRDLKEKIPFIFGELGCRVLHLLPVHPTPTTFARMGSFGSPYAALSFTDVDGALARFDPAATPMEQFLELADAVHYHNGHLFLDIAINHTGWGATIHEKHPEWLMRKPDGQIEQPGAWGVVWEDLTRLDYSNQDLWKYMADIFLLWCSRGVDGYRCDAGYMIPVKAWEYIVAKVRDQYPETVFFLEGLGGPVDTMCRILGKANFNWAYSELFQNYDRNQLENYLPQVFDISAQHGSLVHFAETHDNLRLASFSKTYARMRTALSALMSVCGGFGFANGVEWFAEEKIDVHDICSLNWGAEENQVADIRRLNLILKNHPAFFSQTRLKLVQKGEGNCIALLRHHGGTGKQVLALVNLDCLNPQTVTFDAGEVHMEGSVMFDLLSERPVELTLNDSGCSLLLEPGRAALLCSSESDLAFLNKDPCESGIPDRVREQRLKAKIWKIYTFFGGYGDTAGFDAGEAVEWFSSNPAGFISSLAGEYSDTRVVVLKPDRDQNRRVMVPPGFFLLVVCDFSFSARLVEDSGKNTTVEYERALPNRDGKSFFAVFEPVETSKRHSGCTLKIRIHEQGCSVKKDCPVLYLADYDSLVMESNFSRKKISKDPSLKALQTTKKGGMYRAAASWGRLESRYDALIAANLSSYLPEDRWIMLSRMRIWCIFQGYSRELAPDCLESFSYDHDRGGRWRFRVPTSEGKYYPVELSLKGNRTDNRIRLKVGRHSRNPSDSLLDPEKRVRVVIRPDIEDRSFHETVKAYTGPEEKWKASIRPVDRGFAFEPDTGRRLVVKASRGVYRDDPEWQYMVHRPLDRERGLDPDSDLFSPGYFDISLAGKDMFYLDAGVETSGFTQAEDGKAEHPEACAETRGKISQQGFRQAVYGSLDAFVVERGPDNSVIAGYPWFLDWGRDSLIFCRALIELGRFEEAKGILRLFGRFESGGTLPNMICGEDAGNIETSDAPLWFIAACRELVEKEPNCNFLRESLGERTVGETVLSIVEAMASGTDTGVFMDKESCLIYSPSHFTWMDTNFPAGSPRQGYPVEIQALWYYALEFVFHENLGGERGRYKEWAAKLKQNIMDLFFKTGEGYFSDCLHAGDGGPAAAAEADDALRPNQLLLITLNVVDDVEVCMRMLESCMELLVPGAVRSLADRPVSYPLEIRHNGKSLKDPYYPYSGRYAGDEDTERKPAYHNGTAWTWQFPMFCEAWAATFQGRSADTALAWLGSSVILLEKGAAGFIPEILDGDFPHSPRGCDAQAWGSSELARVIHKLESARKS